MGVHAHVLSVLGGLDVAGRPLVEVVGLHLGSGIPDNVDSIRKVALAEEREQRRERLVGASSMSARDVSSLERGISDWQARARKRTYLLLGEISRRSEDCVGLNEQRWEGQR